MIVLQIPTYEQWLNYHPETFAAVLVAAAIGNMLLILFACRRKR